MAFKLFDRVKDTSTTTGTGAFTLANSAPNGYRTFGSVLSSNDKTIYCIEHQSSNEWEIGIGTYSSNVLTRGDYTKYEVYSSSNSGQSVNFSAGTKNVFITHAVGRSEYQSISPLPAADTYASLGSYNSTYPNLPFFPKDSPYDKLICNGTNPQSSPIMGFDHYLPLAGKIPQVPFDGTGITITLSGSIDNSVTSLTVSSTTFTNGQTWTVPFMIQIDSEVLLVTATASSTYTVTRAYDGTSAASHTSGATISYLAWRWSNQGTATSETNHGGLNIINETANASTVACNVYCRPLPNNASGNYTIKGAIIPRWNEIVYGLPLIGLRDSTTGKIRANTLFRYDGATATYWWRYNLNNSTGSSASSGALTSYMPFMTGPIFYFKFVDDSTNSLFYLSADNRNWGLAYSETRTTHCTADQFVFGVIPYSKTASNHLVTYNDVQ